MGEVLADVDDDDHLRCGEGEEEPPAPAEVHDAQTVDALAGEAVAGGVAADPFEGLDGSHERRSDAAPESPGGLATGGGPGDPESLGRGQSCALAMNS